MNQRAVGRSRSQVAATTLPWYRRRSERIVFATLILASCCWLFVSPYVIFKLMQDAAHRRDAAALADYVDFPALRESLKASLTSLMAKQAPIQDNPFTALGAMLAFTFIDRMIDGLVTPEGLASMMSGIPPSPGPPQKANQPERSEGEIMDTPRRTMRYESFGRFTIEIGETNGAVQPIAFVMRRDWLSWKLSAIRVTSLGPRQ